MIIFDPGGGEPTQWAVCFSRKSATVNWLPLGRYKHVRVFGCVPHINTWIFFDPSWRRTTIRVARGDVANELMREFLYLADVIQMPAGERAGAPIFGWCVPAVAHLLGLPSGAFRPCDLYRQCLANGGTLMEAPPVRCGKRNKPRLLADGHAVIHPAADRSPGLAG
jgi:hypothetical protein